MFLAWNRDLIEPLKYADERMMTKKCPPTNPKETMTINARHLLGGFCNISPHSKSVLFRSRPSHRTINRRVSRRRSSRDYVRNRKRELPTTFSWQLTMSRMMPSISGLCR